MKKLLVSKESSARTAIASGCVALLATASLVALTGCGGGGGGGSSSPPPSGGSPPPSPPPPPPPPPAGGGTDLPPQSKTAIDLDDNHQVGADHWSSYDTSDGGQGQDVGTIQCLINRPETYHVHSHLDIFLNGEQLSVPDHVGAFNMGSQGNCYYAIHTHDKSGKIHVEDAQAGMFTLGNLFQIWGQPLDSTNVAGLTGMPVRIFIVDDGVVSEVAAADWKNIELKSHREIAIQVGTAITEIPNFTWSAH